jgi:hypothetical protein
MNLMRKIVFVFCIAFLSLAAFAEANLDFTNHVQNAKNAIYRLNIEQAEKYRALERSSNPDNLFLPYLDQCESTLDLLFGRAHVNNTYTKFVRESAARIELLKKNRIKSKYWYYLLGEMEFQVAVVSAKKHADVNAAKHIRLALIYLQKNRDKYPDFYANTKTLAVIKEAIQSLPESYKKLVKVVGFDVSQLPSRIDLEKQVDSGSLHVLDSSYAIEANYFLALMDLYLANDSDKAWQRINKITQDLHGDLLKTLLRVQFAIKCHKLGELGDYNWYSPMHNGPYLKAPIMLYFEGVVSLSDLHYSGGFALYSKLGGTALNRNASLNLYYISYLRGSDNADIYLRSVLRKGKVLNEKERNAYKLAKEYKRNAPPKNLLKSRLLFDGGYYQRALDSLGDSKEHNYSTLAQKLEYNYRKGRIYEELKNEKLAILFYLEVLKKSSTSKDYYASYAALHIAQIYEQKGQTNKAIKAYSETLDVCKGKEYQKTVELKAKAGLTRLKSSTH